MNQIYDVLIEKIDDIIALEELYNIFRILDKKGDK